LGQGSLKKRKGREKKRLVAYQAADPTGEEGDPGKERERERRSRRRRH